MMRARSILVLLVVALGIAPALLASAPLAAGASFCPAGLRTLEGVGLVCPRANGLYEVYDSDLRSLGFTHGTDPVPAPGPAPADGTPVDSGTSVNCVSGAAGTYFVQVIYARATDDIDQYTALVNQVRWLVGQANKLVDDAAVATGSTASLNVKCVSGDVEVRHEILPTAMASASFSTIVTDLRNLGYNDGKVKYWVFYDDTGACTCGGTGHLYGDDSLAVTNFNNGNAASMFAVDFGYNSTNVWLHELSHNLGAVQNSAPHSSLAGHCYDGWDVMCYNDGGANASHYSTSYCTTQIYDCGKDDYFNANPSASSYLASHWNIGNGLDRFLTFPVGASPPTLSSFTCSPASVETNATLTCTFLATDPDSTGVRYTVSWGDSTSTVYPDTGYTAPGASHSATHSYPTSGARTVSATVVDDSGHAGNTLSTSVSAFYDPPVLNLLSCPTPIEAGRSAACTFRAADNSPGVRYTIDWGDSTSSTVPAAGYATPGTQQSASHTWSTTGTMTVTAHVIDSVGNVGATRSTTTSIVADLTPPSLTVTDPRAGEIYRGCSLQESAVSEVAAVWVQAGCIRATITDAKSGVDRMEVFVNNVRVGTVSAAPFTLEVPVSATAQSVPVRIDAYDHAGNKASVTKLVDTVNA